MTSPSPSWIQDSTPYRFVALAGPIRYAVSSWGSQLDTTYRFGLARAPIRFNVWSWDPQPDTTYGIGALAGPTRYIVSSCGSYVIKLGGRSRKLGPNTTKHLVSEPLLGNKIEIKVKKHRKLSPNCYTLDPAMDTKN